MRPKGPEVRVNDFICMKKSLKLSWKVYYIVLNVVQGLVECVRCSTTIPNTYVYTMSIDEVSAMRKCSIQIVDYIQKQFEKWKEEIDDEQNIEIYLNKTQESIKLLREDIDVITFYTKGDDKKFYTFEVADKQPVLLPNPYRSSIYGRNTHTYYEWIRVTLGRKFNVDNTCVRRKEAPWFQEDS